MKSLIPLAILATAGTVQAQAVGGFDSSDAIAPTSVVEGAGVKVGEGTVLRPVLGVETGFISNVFFEEDSPQAAGLLRVLAQIGAGSLGRARLTRAGEVDTNPETYVDNDGRSGAVDNQGAFQYRADLRLAYDLYLSGNDAVQEQGGLGAGGLFRGVVNPNGTWRFGFLEDFQRIIRATNFESDQQTNRIVNHIDLRLVFAPEGRSVSATLRYDNQIDYFESDNQQFSNRILHALSVRGMWRVLPVTRLFVDLRQGFNSALGSESMKVSSSPLTVEAGLQTLLGINTTLTLHAGYTNGFYSSGPSFSAPTFGTQLGYRYSPLGRVTLAYEYLHADSINANFFRDHLIRGTLMQGFEPFVLTLRPELHFRSYRGVIVPGASSMDREDVIIAMTAGAHYNFRNWLAATIDYRLAFVSTDFRYMPEPGVQDDPGFVRHELLAGVRAAL